MTRNFRCCRAGPFSCGRRRFLAPSPLFPSSPFDLDLLFFFQAPATTYPSFSRGPRALRPFFFFIFGDEPLFFFALGGQLSLYLERRSFPSLFPERARQSLSFAESAPPGSRPVPFFSPSQRRFPFPLARSACSFFLGGGLHGFFFVAAASCVFFWMEQSSPLFPSSFFHGLFDSPPPSLPYARTSFFFPASTREIELPSPFFSPALLPNEPFFFF